ncbi:hypothetical protein CTEN210_02729 [Chaetoceros tenuissimus]|uniref:MYND-type domain-containing protein n=1 Tax=Chaetoceros tenuissimus TaxID=426638 RepID=A0AAD3CJH5_9STRA|nr:hypothetical protein CTEN210_02729 [Chaetoceros tenuissimus]
MTAPTDVLCKEAAKLKLEGNDLFKAKKYEAAASKYREAIDKDQSNAVYYTNFCACLNQLKLYKEMHTVATKCIDIDANSVKGHYWLVMSLKKQKKYKEAFVQCDSSLENFPDNADIKLLQSEIGMKVKCCANEKCPVPVTGQEAFFKCSACKDTYYCSRDCQKSDWPRHRYTCKSTPKQALCSCCGKKFDGKRRVRCEICKDMSYCSIKCKEEDKEQHERDTCVPNFKEKELSDKWYETDAANRALSELATHAMSKEEFLNRNLEFFIRINLRFSGRYCSFVPIEPPRIVYKNDMNPREIEYLHGQQGFKKAFGSSHLGHIVAVGFLQRDGQEIIFHHKNLLQGYRPDQYRCLPFEEAMTSNFNHANCKDNPIIPPTWKKIGSDIFSNNLNEWALEAKNSGILVEFVLTSFGRISKASYRSSKKYSILIEYEFGERLGEIKRLKSHRIMKISDIKSSSLVNEIKKSLNENVSDENHFPFSLAMVCNNFGSGSMTMIVLNISIELMKEHMKRRYDDVIEKLWMEKLWQDLMKIPFPKCPPTPEYPDI